MSENGAGGVLAQLVEEFDGLQGRIDLLQSQVDIEHGLAEHFRSELQKRGERVKHLVAGVAELNRRLASALELLRRSGNHLYRDVGWSEADLAALKADIGSFVLRYSGETIPNLNEQ